MWCTTVLSGLVLCAAVMSTSISIPTTLGDVSAVDTADIVDSAVSGPKIATGAVGTTTIAASAVSTGGASQADSYTSGSTNEENALTLTISTSGAGLVVVMADLQSVETIDEVVIRLRKGDGTLLDTKSLILAIPNTTGPNAVNTSVTLIGLDQSPAASQQYRLTVDGASGQVYDNLRLVAFNLKR